jgi:hypothetical protein
MSTPVCQSGWTSSVPEAAGDVLVSADHRWDVAATGREIEPPSSHLD